MDSTPNPIPHQPISIKLSSATKLPVKRKTPDPNFPAPKLESSTAAADCGGGEFSTPPPFKFHRIWTEPDEIRFLQGLLSAERLSFPRDLHIFYARFSDTMSQPYTKSQLSEKLRRLKKKFRVISSRLARGLDGSQLSPHDRALYELCRKLWSPEYANTSPFGKNSGSMGGGSGVKKVSDCNLVGVKVSFSPTLPLMGSIPIQGHEVLSYVNDDDHEDGDDDHENGDNVGIDFDGNGVKISEVNVGYDFGGQEEDLSLPLPGGDDVIAGGGDLGGVAARTVLKVFDESLKEVRMILVRQGLHYPDKGKGLAASGSSVVGVAVDFDRRWREQRVAELDVLAQRLRLVLEKSLRRR